MAKCFIKSFIVLHKHRGRTKKSCKNLCKTQAYFFFQSPFQLERTLPNFIWLPLKNWMKQNWETWVKAFGYLYSNGIMRSFLNTCNTWKHLVDLASRTYVPVSSNSKGIDLLALLPQLHSILIHCEMFCALKIWWWHNC